MFALSKVATCAAVGTFIVIGGLSLPARAGDPIRRLGPVGPDEAITTTFGSKGVIAFYEPDGAHCGLYAVVYNREDESGATAVQVRMSLNARQVVNIDGADQKSLSLQCGTMPQHYSLLTPARGLLPGPENNPSEHLPMSAAFHEYGSDSWRMSVQQPRYWGVLLSKSRLVSGGW